MPFDRLDAEQSGVEGTGLGLILSLRLVEAMGGQLGVESTPGQGSTFWIDLAQVEAPVLQLTPAEHALLPAPMTAQQHTLLYIEDNLSNLNLVERILERRPGIKLLSAMQGSVGIEFAREHRPDLILLDLHLPDLDGYAVLHRLRAEPATRSVPVVVISADATPGQLKRLLGAGAQDYLTKPLDVAKFLRVIDSILQD